MRVPGSGWRRVHLDQACSAAAGEGEYRDRAAAVRSRDAASGGWLGLGEEG
jgi:hypothetical protein